MVQALVDFWFSETASQYWFKSTEAFDQQLRDDYAGLWQQAKDGELDNWKAQPMGCLALVILLDQLPLNMFRGTAKSFSTEAQSRDVAAFAVDHGFDVDMATKQKAFLYMPFMHSEDLDDQARSLELFDQPGLESNFRFAKHHYGIVDQFGRFPHRNQVLGRDSSAAEDEYLSSDQAFKG
jgi:uncharacterized protein (DUF924 family)